MYSLLGTVATGIMGNNFSSFTVVLHCLHVSSPKGAHTVSKT